MTTKEELVNRLKQGRLRIGNKESQPASKAIVEEPTATGKPIRRRKAITEYCVWCCNGNKAEVSKCPSINCVFHPVRLASLSSKGLSLKKLVKQKCLDCSGSRILATTCMYTTCILNKIITHKKSKHLLRSNSISTTIPT